MINKIILVGRVGADPEIKTMGESGVKTARLRLATTEKWFNKETNQSEELTEWHNVTLWRALADVADKYVRKGTKLYVEGSIHYRKWQGQDGVERFSTDITADVVRILSGKAEQTAPAEPQYQPPQYPIPGTAKTEPEVEQYDLPF